MITFQARYINTAEILKKDTRNCYNPCKTAFIEFNPKEFNDVTSIIDAVSDWNSQPNFAECIAESAELVFRMQDEFPDLNRRFFAITKQKDGFDKIKPANILGVLQLSKFSDKCNIIDFVQVSHGGEDLFKHVGSSILQRVRELFPDKKTILFPATKELIPFYQKNGFKSVPHSNYLIG